MCKQNQLMRWGFFALLALCMTFGVLANAQSTTEGGIAGTVFDSTGAVVSGATVTIHNDATDAVFKVTTDASGYFKEPLLPAASYTVTVDATGFGSFKLTSVITQVGQLTEIEPHIKAGTTTTVEVSGEAPILNFESPDISSVLNTRAIEDIPLNGGRWSDMTLLTPGAVADSSGFGLIAFRGISPILNNVEIDGADDNDAYYSEERGRTREGYSTSKYMVQEFQVNTGVYSTEYGRAAGGVINAISKSGSNTLHAMMYFSDRDNDWGAINPFTTNTTAIYGSGGTIPTSFVTGPYKPIDWRKEWGFDAGGALKKDKLFWFYGFAQYRRNFPGTAKANTPGSFFVTPDAAAPAGSVCNTTTGYMSGTTNVTDEQSCALAARLGLGSYAAGASTYSTQLGNLLSDLGSTPRTGNEELNTPKLDWQINSKNKVSFLFHRLRWDSPGGVQTQATNTYAIDTFGTDFVKLDYGLSKLISEITPNLVNEVRYQYSRELLDEGQQPYSAYTQKYLESTNGITNTPAYNFTPNVPEVALDTSIGFYMGSPYYSYRHALPDERKWQIGDTASWQHGNHSIKFGVDMVHNYDLMANTYESNGVYTYSYIGNYFADLLNEAKGATGVGVCEASGSPPIQTGTATQTAVGTAPCGAFVQGFGPPAFDLATMDYGFFVEDHWKLTPRLTFDVGARYDYESLPAPYASLIAPGTGFSPYLGSSTTGLCTVGTASKIVTGCANIPLAANANLANHPSDKDNIGPRIGLAYDLFGDGKTTLRAGYGLYFGRVTNGTLLTNLLNTGSPLGQYTTASYKPNTAGAPYFPNILAPPSTPSVSSPSSYFYASNFRNPQVHEFELSVQQEVTRGTVASVTYLGSLGRELPNWININLNPLPNTVAGTGTPNGVLNSLITIADPSGKGPLAAGTQYIVPTYNNLINSNFGSVTQVTSNINSSYNALVAEVQNKSAKMFQFDANYTWSHALDDNQNETTTDTSNGAFDPYNIEGFPRGGNWGNSAFNVANRLVAWALVNFPNAHQKSWTNWFTNDWSFNPLFQGQNGLPYTASIGSGFSSNSAYGSSWNGAGAANSQYWIPAIGRFTYPQQRTLELDMRLEKQFVLDEKYHLQLLGEVFNVANHQNVTGVSSTAYNAVSNSSLTPSSSCPTNSGQTQAECSTYTFVPQTGSGISASGFGAVSNANSNFAYSQREVQLSVRLDF